MFDDTNHEFLGITFDFDAPGPRTRAKKGPKIKKAKRAPVNYRGRSTEATLRKQEAILTFLELAGEGATVLQIGQALGISRQLALYHLKKMAASYQLVMMLEPCLENGGLQFKCWKQDHLAEYFARFSAQLRRSMAFNEKTPARKDVAA